MTLTSLRKVLWLALVGTGCLIFLLLLLSAKRQPGTLDLRLAGQPQMTNGVMVVSIVLSNGTSRSLNIIEDTDGNPFVVLDAGAGSNAPGTIGFGLGILTNALKLNLAPGAALPHAVRLTNPPPRFRLLVEARDLGSESGRALMALLELAAAKATGSKRAPHGLILLPASPWIENGESST